MKSSVVIPTRMDKVAIKRVDRVAAAEGRSRSSFVALTLTEAVKREAAFFAFVQEGINDLDAGRTVPHEIVMAALEAMIAKHQARCSA
jgi:predicted transcriptional regulator